MTNEALKRGMAGANARTSRPLIPDTDRGGSQLESESYYERAR